MPFHESQSTLYKTTARRFAEITAELPDYPEKGYFLSIHDKDVQSMPFHDPDSRFEVDEAGLTGIERMEPYVYTLCLDFFRGSATHARTSHPGNTSHVVVLTQEGPPALMHNRDFSDTRTSTSSILPKLLKSGQGEVLSPERAIHLHAALGRLSADHIDISEEF